MARTLKNLDNGVFNLDGTPLRGADGPLTVGSIIANAIARGQSQEPARAMKVALSVYGAKKELTLEDADFKLAKDAVEADQILNNMAKAAALPVFDAAVEPG